MALASGPGLALCEVMPTHLPLRSLWHSDALYRARQQLLLRDESTVATQIAVSEIAAPTGEEHARATWIAERFRRLGLCDVRTDEAGNVIGSRRGVADEPPVVVCAHLDTVFPHGTEVSVTRAGARLAGPGIGDNGRGLAAMLALAEVIDGRQLRTVAPVEFIATTGEEGAGDLRPLAPRLADAAVTAAIALDGAGDERIVNRALGSRRYRIAFHGPGGHSWTAFGVPNAVHAAAIAAAKLARLPLPREPRTTLSVGRIGGGISVNTIPDEGWLEIDVRSTSCYALDLIERELRHVARVARDEENDRSTRGSAPLSVVVQLIGDRPSGETAASHPLVVMAMEATRLVGREPELATASTDANVPISRGIPAIAIGAGGRGGDAHTHSEWFDNVHGTLGVARALTIVMATAGLQ